MTWNPYEPEAWAALLGLVAVPLFGHTSTETLEERNAVLLDGTHGSFTFSLSERTQSVRRRALEQAWSSNVRHAVTIDKASLIAHSSRWDEPDASSEWDVSRPEGAKRLLRSLEHAPSPRTDQTVIARGMRVFNDIRHIVEERGGTPLDVVRIFNATVAIAAYSRRIESQHNILLKTAVQSLKLQKRIDFDREEITPSVRDLPLGEMIALFTEQQDLGPYVLDVDLMVRHAGGTLYQEAHRQLAEPLPRERQLGLFDEIIPLPLGRQLRRTEAPSYIHYTPASLARILAELALNASSIHSEGPITILDPACGSGVFLVEAARELLARGEKGLYHLVGFDNSAVAVEMSDFCVRNTCADFASGQATWSIEQRDSLDRGRAWSEQDIVLMNPPFVAWEALEVQQRRTVETVLGPLMRGRPDFASAFVVKALTALRPGGVLATVVPSSFLSSDSTAQIRRWICDSPELHVDFIGLFTGYDLFPGATVNPALLVISRRESTDPVRIMLAAAGSEERAIRAVRVAKRVGSHIRAGYEIYSLPVRSLNKGPWTPRDRRSRMFMARLSAAVPTTINDFLTPRLGIRPGNKPAFELTTSEFEKLSPSPEERRFFRPVADVIRNGRIIESGFIFYPYGKEGLLLRSESALRRAVPKFFKSRLLPAKEKLASRKSLHHRKWWELSEPVATWLTRRESRIVSMAFGRAGNFALDEGGRRAVVQGVAWCWNGMVERDVLLAYLAILSSDFFDEMLAAYCPRTRGGQYDLTAKYIKNVPLPELGGGVLGALAAIGSDIHSGRHFNRKALNRLVDRAFGFTNQEFHDSDRVAVAFHRLAERWRAETSLYSFESRKISHPLYQQIIAMGYPVVQFLLNEMRDDPSYWSAALSEITGADPVPDTAADLEDVARAWLDWGREQGYEV